MRSGLLGMTRRDALKRQEDVAEMDPSGVGHRAQVGPALATDFCKGSSVTSAFPLWRRVRDPYLRESHPSMPPRQGLPGIRTTTLRTKLRCRAQSSFQ